MRTELFTVCEGICGKSFHAECVGVRESDLCALSCNIIWMCDPCMKIFCRMRERNFIDAATNTDMPESLVDDVNVLKSTVAAIAQTLSKVVEKQYTFVPYHRSTPISSPKILNGTNEIACSTKQQECTKHTDLPFESPEPESDMFTLYLTNIDRCATENDISLMVSQSLGASLSDIDVVKLVPKHRNVLSLDYVSFKIALDKRLKPAALTASTWPKGVKFREFVSRTNVTWKPA